ncbi:MAG: hypothetical protein ACRDYA_15450 [Egibacteraceae bacterium]
MSAITRYAKSGKARFDHVYNLPDPRGYFRALQGLAYKAPVHGARVFPRLVARQREQLDREDLVVLDLCCSYGINAALLNHDLTLDALYERYCSPGLDSLSTQELVTADRAFYRDRRRPSPVQVVGLDVAENAVAYARRVGLHVGGSSENLEQNDPDRTLGRALTAVDLITVTGGVGYISECTFNRVLEHASARSAPWVAAFPLRWTQYSRIAKALAKHGLETEKLTGHTFAQRRFADPREQDYVLNELETMGIDTEGKEAEGWYHTEFYLSRPAGQIRSLPLEELLAGCV